MNVITVEEYRKMTAKGDKRATPEHDEQVKVFEWAEIMKHKYPELEMLFAVPNGAFYGRHWSVAKKMKAEGVKSGVPDIFLAVVKRKKHGLWIEMKAGKNKPNEQQKWWIEKLEEQDYRVEVCYSAEEAIGVIEDYLR